MSRRVRVPRYLHKPIQILWFDVEDIALIVVMYVLWLVIDRWWILPAVVLVPYWFRELKLRKPRGYLRHLLYQFGFERLRGYPPPASREFRE